MNIVKKAFLRSVPVMAGYMVLGMGFGIMLKDAGYGVIYALAMSLLIYAGSMQYVGIGLITGGATVLTTVITTFMVNARHLFYSISMIGKYKGAGKYKPYLIFALTDETYSLLSSDPESDNRYRFLVSMFNHIYWVLGSVIGSALGAVLPFSTKGIEFSMTALFIASFTEQWIESKDHIPALTGILCTVFSLVLFGPDRFLIPAMLLITLVLTLIRSREEKA
ncbi:MAG: AzlC family ABC transporter permease [Lachnospiraceae bacterium]|jgi:4-azaleucine resistance transporter AzlC|nr:AzlC family ABC transporter permease [Lachnospiraceae bacterium]